MTHGRDVKQVKPIYKLGKYPQTERRFYTIADGLPANRITCLAAAPDGVWAGTEGGIARLAGDRWEIPRDNEGDCPPAAPVLALLADRSGRIWSAAGERLYVREHGVWRRSDLTGPIYALAEDDSGKLWAATDTDLHCFRHGAWTHAAGLESSARVRHIAAYGDSQVFLATDKGLHYLHGKRAHFFETMAKPGQLVSDDVRCVYADRWEHLWIATDKGVNIYDNKRLWYTLNGAKGLPYEDVRTIAVGDDGGRWFGTSHGAIRLKDGLWKYYASKRWLPNDNVRAIAVSRDGTVWIGTDDGIAKLTTRFMKLEEKAEHYEQVVRKHHVRDGYVTVKILEEEGNLDSGLVEKSDNDGYWTAVYIAAQAFRYAVTGNEEAKRWARQSMESLLFLTSVTNWPGFPARAVRRRTDPEFGDNVVKPLGWVESEDGKWEWKAEQADVEIDWHEWRRTADGEWEWKGDTSSDEIVGHFYIYSIYYDLVADGEEKLRIAATARAIADHLIRNGFQLIDIDNEPPTWSVWSPEKLNGDSKWESQRGVNSLQLLSLLKATAHMTGDDKYEQVYRDLIMKHHYAMNTLEQKLTFLGRVSHIDDDLGFHAYYPLLVYETDPDLRALYMMSIEHHWQYERRERSPMWNFLYGALTGRDCDVEAAVRSLAEMPLDLIHWPIRNSHRADVKFDPELEPHGYKQMYEPLPFDERPTHKWDANPFEADGGNGLRAEDGTVFLHPYWLARYWKLIDEPTEE